MSYSVAGALYAATEQAYEGDLTFEILPTDPMQLPAACVRTLTTNNPIVRAYRCGDAIERQLWAVCCRVSVRSDDQRACAVASVKDLADLACAVCPDLPRGFEFYKTTQTDAPALIEATSDYETWQVSLETTYKRIRLR